MPTTKLTYTLEQANAKIRELAPEFDAAGGRAAYMAATDMPHQTLYCYLSGSRTCPSRIIANHLACFMQEYLQEKEVAA